MRYIFESIKGAATFLLLAAQTMVLAPAVILLGVVKLLLPFTSVLKICSSTIILISERWVGNNRKIFKHMHRTQWEVLGL